MWKFVRIGFYARRASPQRVQRYRCDTCRRRFSDQTFSSTYWMRRPEILVPVFHRLVGCSGFRQIAREQASSPETIARASARLGRHSLLLHELTRPRGPVKEPLALDSFESFEWSQYHPTSYHVAVGRESHYFYGFTESECRRRGTMTDAQKRRRADLELRLGRPDPRSIEKDVAALLEVVASRPQASPCRSAGSPTTGGRSARAAWLAVASIDSSTRTEEPTGRSLERSAPRAYPIFETPQLRY